MRDVHHFAVTCAEYLEFLNDRTEHSVPAALEKSRRRAARGEQYWERQGEWIVIVGRVQPDWPVFTISWHDAKEYAAWVTRRRGEGSPSTPLWGKMAVRSAERGGVGEGGGRRAAVG